MMISLPPHPLMQITPNAFLSLAYSLLNTSGYKEEGSKISPISKPQFINPFLLLHLDRHILRSPFPEILQQVASLKVLVRMHDRLELRGAPRAVILDTFDFLLIWGSVHPDDEGLPPGEWVIALSE